MIKTILTGGFFGCTNQKPRHDGRGSEWDWKVEDCGSPAAYDAVSPYHRARDIGSPTPKDRRGLAGAEPAAAKKCDQGLSPGMRTSRMG